MVLDIPGNLFGDRNFTEGVSPETRPISRSEDLTQNISRALAVKTYTLNHTATNTIQNIYDDSRTSYLQWQITTKASATTTLILDLGKEVFVHNTLIFAQIGTGAGSDADVTITTSYSSDDSSYTQIDTDTINASAVAQTLDVDHFLTAKSYRYLKIVFNSQGEDDTQDRTLKLYEVLLVR